MRIIQPRLNYSLTIKELFVSLIGYLFHYDKKLPTKYFDNNDNIFFFDSARSGLQCFLEMLPPNTRIGVQPLTCHTVLESIENANCKVIFIDINEKLVIDKTALLERINDIDVLILTHTFGMMADVTEIKSLMNDKILIEDCAHSFLSTYNGISAGETADVSIFSFGFAKFPSAIKGGYISLNNSNFLHGFRQKYNEVLEPTFKSKVFNKFNSILMPLLNTRLLYSLITSRIKENRKINYNYHKPKIRKIICSYFKSNKAVFQVQLNTIDKRLSSQKVNGYDILKALSTNDKFQVCQNNEGQNNFMIPVLLKSSEDFVEYAKNNGIEIGRHFYYSKLYIKDFGYKDGTCPNYENIIEKLVTFPSHYNYPIKSKLQLLKLIDEF